MKTLLHPLEPDEIGKMECQSDRFVTGVRQLLDRNRPVIATVAQRGLGFISEVKQRAGQIWEVTHHNREFLPDRVVEWIKTLPVSYSLIFSQKTAAKALNGK